MTNDDELTPQNRRIMCERIGGELGISGEFLNEHLNVNTVEGILGFRDALLKFREEEAIRQGYYTPRTSMVDMKPEERSVMTTTDLFVEMMHDLGL